MTRTRLPVLALAFVGSLAGVASAGEQPDPSQERASIEAAARDYIDGWYEGDSERMGRALHPDLAKRTLRALPSGVRFVHTLSRSAMIAFTGAGMGRRNRREGQVNTVTILDASTNAASVKTVSHEFVDYLHLAKVEGEWRIINVLWEPTPGSQKQD